MLKTMQVQLESDLEASAEYPKHS